jgi:hypothetical protein
MTTLSIAERAILWLSGNKAERMSGIKLRQFIELDKQLLGSSFEAFLAHLGGPSVLHINGLQPSRCRVVVTLLHGNEPSGLKAIYQLLKAGVQPFTDIKVIVGSVSAARTEPMFSHRMLPGQRDLNRCFNGPEHDLQGQLAKAISQQINQFSPEAVVDVHNTSGSGPSFCVSISDDRKHLSLASFFSGRCIHTDIRLGSLMEQNFGCPIVTVEAGGAEDPEADNNAFNGLKSFFIHEDLFAFEHELELLNCPRRLELCLGAKLKFAEQIDGNADVTIRQDIERYNFGITLPTDVLGWTDDDTLKYFKLDRADMLVTKFFNVNEGQIQTTEPLKFFMVTTKVEIAKTDCLLYFVETN